MSDDIHIEFNFDSSAFVNAMRRFGESLERVAGLVGWYGMEFPPMDAATLRPNDLRDFALCMWEIGQLPEAGDE